MKTRGSLLKSGCFFEEVQVVCARLEKSDPVFANSYVPQVSCACEALPQSPKAFQEANNPTGEDTTFAESQGLRI